MPNPIVTEDLESIIRHPLPWEEFAGKTVLITGASGMLPAYMVETLLFLNLNRSLPPVRVIGVVRNLERARQRFAEYLPDGNLTLIAQDVSRPLEIPGRVDYVVHAASQASPKYYHTDPVGTILANTMGTHHLLSLARENEVAGFLFFSSCEVYGQVDESLIPISEETCGLINTMSVRSCYAESKRLGETICASWHHQYGLPTRVVRIFSAFGPGLRLDDDRVFAEFIANVIQGKDIVMKSDGSALRTFCYAADAAAGFFTVLLKGRADQAYNIGNDRTETNIRDLAKLVAELFPEKRIAVRRLETDAVSSHYQTPVSRVVPDISRARGLGWSPTTSLDESFRRTILSLQQPA
ncbi:MAG: NAD-dependent epimerase/dehydratase family protein [Caldilineaceae bacterium]|nr:NAD-dependent epimerase/dehydratase family protein [Caldilineaceae bacterium]